MQLIISAKKGGPINFLESHCTQTYRRRGLLIEEQNTGELNPVQDIAHDIIPKRTRI